MRFHRGPIGIAGRVAWPWACAALFPGIFAVATGVRSTVRVSAITLTAILLILGVGVAVRTTVSVSVSGLTFCNGLRAHCIVWSDIATISPEMVPPAGLLNNAGTFMLVVSLKSGDRCILRATTGMTRPARERLLHLLRSHLDEPAAASLPATAHAFWGGWRQTQA